MKQSGQKRPERQQVLRKGKPGDDSPTPASLTYYFVVLIAGVVGVAAYSAGATLEGALVRSGVVLLACTVIGYAANVFLWLAMQEQQQTPAVAGIKPEAHGKVPLKQHQSTGLHIDVTAGDDEADNAEQFERAA